MQYEEIINSWDWRIRKIGHSQKSFSEEIGVHPAQMSRYLKRRANPDLENFFYIEEQIKKREGALDV